jgi:hypothetical protein
VVSNQLSTAGGNAVVKGYEVTMTEGRKTRELGYLSFDNLIKYGAAIAGDPATFIAQLQEIKQRFGITEFALWSSLAGIPTELTEQSMRLAAEKVMPFV